MYMYTFAERRAFRSKEQAAMSWNKFTYIPWQRPCRALPIHSHSACLPLILRCETVIVEVRIQARSDESDVRDKL